jgi:hypothetical protein
VFMPFPPTKTHDYIYAPHLPRDDSYTRVKHSKTQVESIMDVDDIDATQRATAHHEQEPFQPAPALPTHAAVRLIQAVWADDVLEVQRVLQEQREACNSEVEVMEHVHSLLSTLGPETTCERGLFPRVDQTALHTAATRLNPDMVCGVKVVICE